MVRGIYIEMFLAEEEGFEPSVRLCTPEFQSGTLNHSVIPIARVLP